MPAAAVILFPSADRIVQYGLLCDLLPEALRWNGYLVDFSSIAISLQHENAPPLSQARRSFRLGLGVISKDETPLSHSA